MAGKAFGEIVEKVLAEFRKAFEAEREAIERMAREIGERKLREVEEAKREIERAFSA